MVLHRLFVTLALLSVVSIGCNSGGVPLAKVKGQVTYKNKPLEGANVKCYPADGPMAVGITDAEGNFNLTTNGRPGAPLGILKVSITKMSNDAAVSAMPANPSPDDMRKMQMAASSKKSSGPKSEIPEKYASPDSSGLTCDVSSNANDNVFQFDLQ